MSATIQENTSLAVSEKPVVVDEIREAIQAMLVDSFEFDDDDNLLELGLDSLKIMRLVNRWRRAGSHITFADLIETPYLRDWLPLLQKKIGIQLASNKSHTAKIEVDRKKPFPLTDVQYAYWIGRREGQPLGGVGCHAYLEIDGSDVEPQRLELAWKQLLNHHSMLRARFLPDGRQEILDKPFPQNLLVHDLQFCSESEVKSELKQIRKRLSHRRMAVEKGEVIGLELSLLPEGITRLHFDVDLLVADVQSLQIIIRDLAASYSRGCSPAAPHDWCFSTYLKQEKQRRVSEKEKASHYWTQRLSALPGNPGLPLEKKPEAIRKPHFTRRTFTVKNSDWTRLQKQSAIHQVTPAMVLLTVYAEILDRWGTNSRFLINVPLFDRQTDEAGIEDVVADFTNLLLLAVDCSSSQSFEERVRGIQSQFHKDVDNSAYSGVQVQRDMVRDRQGERMIAPFVFACNLGIPLINEECRETLGQLSYMISQTPQVWLDFQIYETDGELLLAWDVIDELFPDGMIDDMFNACLRYIEWLVDKDNDWHSSLDLLPVAQRQRRDSEISFTIPSNTQCLHIAFFNHAAEHPDRIALIDSHTDEHLSYDSLATSALQVAAFLTEQGVVEGDPVAVTFPRGIDQVVAVLGVLACGGCYVPVSPGQPAIRRERIHHKAGIRHVLTNKEQAQTLTWPESTVVLDIVQCTDMLPLAQPVDFSPKNSAYIIFTSGSTGTPKGVDIDHRAAWNTIADINRRYTVSSTDRALAISALDFDLSVYDIFGLLSVGASLVLISEAARRDAVHWLGLIRHYQVTIWNSVPILLNMLLVVTENERTPHLPLRQVMLSGDWIDLDLPSRLENVTENCQFVAMGGATEAAIWSNYFDVAAPLPRHWTSIPYGRPIANQVFRVVDSKGRDCPDWVVGELWIGGAGVAKGYRGESELTTQHFIIWNGTRWYRTGDMGCYWPDGNIEFLGRKDLQVKIRGHRIELGEIEAAMKLHSGVRDAVVVAVHDSSGSKCLVGYVVPEKEAASSLFDIEEADLDVQNAFWDTLTGTGLKAGKTEEDLNPDVAFAFWETVDNLSVVYICRVLNEIGAFIELYQEIALTKLVDMCSIHPRYVPLIQTWLNVLEIGGVLQKNGAGVFVNRCKLPVNPQAVQFPEELKQYPQWQKCVDKLIQYLERGSVYFARLLRGDLDPLKLFFSDEPFLAPEFLTQLLPGTDYTNNLIREILVLILKCETIAKPLRILEVGARTGTFAELLLPMLAQEQPQYTYTDISTFFTDKGKDKLKAYEFVQYKLLDIDQHPQKQGFDAHSYDLLIAPNAMHRARNIEASLNYLRSLLAPGGLLIASEMTKNSLLQHLSVGFIEASHVLLEHDKQNASPLLSLNEWHPILNSCGFEKISFFPKESSIEAKCYFQHILVAQSPLCTERFNTDDLIDLLHRNLPEYMLPSVYIPLEVLPLTDNGESGQEETTQA